MGIRVGKVHSFLFHTPASFRRGWLPETIFFAFCFLYISPSRTSLSFSGNGFQQTFFLSHTTFAFHFIGVRSVGIGIFFGAMTYLHGISRRRLDSSRSLAIFIISSFTTATSWFDVPSSRFIITSNGHIYSHGMI